MQHIRRMVLGSAVGAALGLGAWCATRAGATANDDYVGPLEPVVGMPLSPWALAVDRRLQEGDSAGVIAMLRGAASRLGTDRTLDGSLDASFGAHTLWALGEQDEAAGIFRHISVNASDVAIQIDALRMLATRTSDGALAVADGLEAWRLLQSHRATLDSNWWSAQASHVLQMTALGASASGDSMTAIQTRSALLNSGAAASLPTRGRGSLYLLNARDAVRLGDRTSAHAWYDLLLQNEPGYFADEGERLFLLIERARAVTGANGLAPGAGGPAFVQELFSLWVDPEFALIPERAVLASNLAWELRGTGSWELAGAIDVDAVETLEGLVPEIRADGWTGTAVRLAYEGSMLQAAEWHLRRGELDASTQKLRWLAANASEGGHARIASGHLERLSSGR